MPVIKCSNGKWRVGSSACIYDTEEKANAVLYAIKYSFVDSYNDYPEAAVNNAKRALKWADENGWGTCGTPVGKARANQLANKEPISRDTIARMASFKRQQQNKDVPYKDGCGGLMWDAWGGTAGVEWAITKLKQIDKFSVPEGEVNIFGYHTKNFKLSAELQSLFSHIITMETDVDTQGMIRSAAQIADNILHIKEYSTDHQYEEAVILVDDFKDLMNEIDAIIGMKHDVSFMDKYIININEKTY